MKFISLEAAAERERVLATLSDCETVNRGVKFDENRGKPQMIVKSKGNRIRVSCRYIGGASRDDGFLVGTVFYGRITEREGKTRIRGIVTTAPIYHTVLLALIAFFIYQCIRLGGINPIPIILVVFSLIMFRGEFKKQGVIARYLYRAIRRLDGE